MEQSILKVYMYYKYACMCCFLEAVYSDVTPIVLLFMFQQKSIGTVDPVLKPSGIPLFPCLDIHDIVTTTW